ncbi:MAG: RidA family protein [Cohaesibacter sp.]|nr:RidA family protein [Cohaesibacter sp.]MCV6602857.1 RidA family protein [Cohaesibacter sp.]
MTIERMDSNHRMSKIVKHNGTIYLCGQTSGTEEAPSIEEQTKICLSKIESLLSDAGSSADKLLSVTIYLRDMKDFAAMNAVWDAWIAPFGKPARACVEARLARPELLVEFTVVAAQ